MAVDKKFVNPLPDPEHHRFFVVDYNEEPEPEQDSGLVFKLGQFSGRIFRPVLKWLGFSV